jgi:hypothetical protein
VVKIGVIEIPPFVGAGVAVPVAGAVYASGGLVRIVLCEHVGDVVARFGVVGSDLDASGGAG